MNKNLLLGIIMLMILCMSGCGINKVAYGMIHGNEPAADPEYLSGMTVVNTSTGDKLDRVIDFTYNEERDLIEYVRVDKSDYISGVIKYDDAFITNGSGELRYDKVKRIWVFISNGKVYDIYQHAYKDIEVTKHDD